MNACCLQLLLRVLLVLLVRACVRGRCGISLLVIVPWLGSRACCFRLLYLLVVVLVLRFGLSRPSGFGLSRCILCRACRSAGFRVSLCHYGQRQGKNNESP
jgi:hypothetical protein